MIPLKDNIPTGRFPFVTAGLVLINVLAYILATTHGGSIISGPDVAETLKFSVIPYALTHSGVHCAEVVRQTLVSTGSPMVLCNSAQLAANHIAAQNSLPVWETVFTAMFMHASILHIAGNMIFLWIFGDNIEHAMGPLKYLAFYLIGGLAAIGLQIVVSPNSTDPTLGASGAIAAVLGGYIVLYPRAKVLTVVFIIFLFTVIELPAWALLGLWFAEQALFAAAGLTDPAGSGGGVAYFAHIGGFVFGLLAVRLLATRVNKPPPALPVY